MLFCQALYSRVQPGVMDFIIAYSLLPVLNLSIDNGDLA
jgi:hypothetical protein